MKVIDDDDEFFPPRNIELTNIFRTATSMAESFAAKLQVAGEQNWIDRNLLKNDLESKLT